MDPAEPYVLYARFKYFLWRKIFRQSWPLCSPPFHDVRFYYFQQLTLLMVLLIPAILVGFGDMHALLVIYFCYLFFRVLLLFDVYNQWNHRSFGERRNLILWHQDHVRTEDMKLGISRGERVIFDIMSRPDYSTKYLKSRKIPIITLQLFAFSLSVLAILAK